MENQTIQQPQQTGGVQLETPRVQPQQQTPQQTPQQAPQQVSQPGPTPTTPLPAAFLSLVAKEVERVTLTVNKLNLLEFVKGLAVEAVRVSYETPTQAELVRMFGKEVDNDDAKMERMIATYFPSAKNATNPVKSLITLTVNATSLTPVTTPTSIFDLQNGTDVKKVQKFINKEKLFFDNSVVPTPYEYNPTLGIVKYYVNTLIVLLSYFGINYKAHIEGLNKKVSVLEEVDTFAILIRN